MGVELDSLEIKIESSSAQAATEFDRLTSTLNKLKSVAKGGVGLTTVANQLDRLNTALSRLKVDNEKFNSLSSALKSLGEVQKSTGLSSTINALKKIPDVIDSLDKADLGKFNSQIQQLVTYLKPLASEMEKVSAGFSKLPANIQKAINANAKLTSSSSGTRKNYGVLGTGIKSWQAKLAVYAVSAKRVYDIIGGWVEKSNEFDEKLNVKMSRK